MDQVEQEWTRLKELNDRQESALRELEMSASQAADALAQAQAAAGDASAGAERARASATQAAHQLQTLAEQVQSAVKPMLQLHAMQLTSMQEALQRNNERLKALEARRGWVTKLLGD